MRRNGSYPEGDNLILGYSNPAIMRALVVGWIGARTGNSTFIDFANTQGDQLLQLFQKSQDALSEYNAPNYYGIDVWALAANVAYGPKSATMTHNAEFILSGMWKDVAAHYNSYLGNMAGPYDRAYTRDMTEHSAILSLFWWGMYGRQYGPQPPSFARASPPTDSRMPLLLSGTASVVGHATLHAGSIAAQVDETFANFDALIAAARARRRSL